MSSLIFLNECSSTNEKILHFLPVENNGLLSVYTFNQTKGKGQYGNSWKSSENLNLAFSIAVPVSLIQLPTHLLNFHTALTVAQFFAIMTNVTTEIKWPNDLIIKNKKVAGLLIEKKKIGEISYYIFGIGINVLQNIFPKLEKAGSLLTQTGVTFNLQEFSKSFHNFLTEKILNPKSPENLMLEVNERLFKKNQISVFEMKGLRQNGIIRNIDIEGYLWIDLEKEGLKKFWHKEIKLLY